MKRRIHLFGYIFDSSDGVTISERKNNYGCIISSKLATLMDDAGWNPKPSKCTPSSKYAVEESAYVDNVSVKIFLSEEKCTLDDAENNQILASIGEIDILQTWFGYSEFTILGYDTENFKLVSTNSGEHDLENILNSNNGRYVHIIIEKLLGVSNAKETSDCVLSDETDKKGAIIQDENMVYKNDEAFDDTKNFNRTCYIAKFLNIAYTRRKILELCDGSVEIAEQIYEQADGQCIESILENWFIEGKIIRCTKCCKLFLSDGKKMSTL